MQILQIISVFFLFIIIFLVISFSKNFNELNYLENQSFLIIFFVLFSLQIYEFFRRTVYINSKIFILIKMDLLRYFFQLSILFICLNFEFKNISFILSLFGFSCIFSLFFVRNHLPSLNLNPKSLINTFKRNWVISKWLISNSMFQWFESNFLLFLINIILGPSSLGIYRAFQSILGVNNIFLHSIDSWLPVKTSKDFQYIKKEIFKKRFLKILFFISIIASTLFLILIFYSKEILSIYDNSLIEYFQLFRIFCLAYLFMTIYYPIKNILLGIEKTSSFLLGSIISVLSMISAGPYLITKFGLTGAIFTFTISKLLILLTNLFFLNKKFSQI